MCTLNLLWSNLSYVMNNKVAGNIMVCMLVKFRSQYSYELGVMNIFVTLGFLKITSDREQKTEFFEPVNIKIRVLVEYQSGRARSYTIADQI